MSPSPNTDYTARERHEDTRTRRQIRRIAEEWVPIPVATASQSVDGLFTFGVYASAGTAIPGLGAAPIVTMQPWTDGAGTVYLFKWNSTLHKMLVTDGLGTEIAAGVDLSAIANHPYHAVLASTQVPSGLARLSGSGRVKEVRFDLASAWTASASNYWTVTAYIRRQDQPTVQAIGEVLGTLRLSNRSLAALDDVPLYRNDHGVSFHDSDRLSLVEAATGNPLPLIGLRAWARIERSTDT